MNLENFDQRNCMLQRTMDLCACTMGQGPLCVRMIEGTCKAGDGTP